ncbi:MAG: sigma-54-dependent Fis family transcriptional regulator [Bacteroidia bacterium]|nr:sigma-54-dependent Fis family transcriptional regulator [Bacteroidia bacterium]
MTNEETYNNFAPEAAEHAEQDSQFWKILIVDDLEDVHRTTMFALKNYTYQNKGIKFLRAYNNLGAKAHLENNPDISVVLLDVVMNESGLNLIPFIRENEKTKFTQIILRTGEPDEAPEREVVEKYEINDYIAKPDATQDKLFTSITASIRAYTTLIKLDSHRKELEQNNKSLEKNNTVLTEKTKIQEDQLQKIQEELISKELEVRIGTKFVGQSGQIKDIRNKALNIAKFDECVLVSGENGVGKEIIAHMIHLASSKKNNAFLAFNCTAISENLVESILFGYKKGAFTGAIADNKGYFKSADKGTLFIDEIGEMDLNVQVKLLRAIEYNEIIAIGSNIPEKINVRVIAATNHNLEQLVGQGKFREDLYYRINTCQIYIPPLRERIDDIEPLVKHFIEAFAKKYNILAPEIDNDALGELKKYSFPGNIRELKNIVYNALINSNGRNLSSGVFNLKVKPPSVPELIENGDYTLATAINVARFNAIKKAKDLAKTGKIDEICAILDIPRANYYRYLKELGM